MGFDQMQHRMCHKQSTQQELSAKGVRLLATPAPEKNAAWDGKEEMKSKKQNFH